MIAFKEYMTEEYQYDEFVKTVDFILENPNSINEGILDSLTKFVGDEIEFIKDLSEKLGVELMTILKIFKEKVVFKFFTNIGWSIKELVSIVHKGYKLWGELQKVIAKYIADTKIVKFTEQELKKLDAFLNKHPIIKKAGSLVVSGFLIYQWTQMISFTADIDFDFDQSTLFAAIVGNYSLADLFASPDGIQMLLFIATGALTGMSFPWPGPTWLLFAASIVYTVAKDKYPQVATYILKNAKKFKSYK